MAARKPRRARHAVAGAIIFAGIILAASPARASHTPPDMNGFDNFDAYTLGVKPGDPIGSGNGRFYDTTTTCGIITKDYAYSGTKSYFATSASATCTSAFVLKQQITCPSDVVLEARIYHTGAVNTRFYFQQNGAAWSVTFSTTSAILEKKDNGGSFTQAAFINGITIALNTWYKVQIKNLCANSWVGCVDDTCATGGHPVVGPNDPTTRHLFIAYAQASAVAYIDDLRVTGFRLPAAATTAAFPAGYTLTGFSADYMQRGVIARLEKIGPVQQAIYSFDPLSLALRGATPVTSTCTELFDTYPGLMATWRDPPGRSYIGYLDCAADPTEVDTLRIRDADLGTPDKRGTICDPEHSGVDNDFCSIDLPDGSATSTNCWNDGRINIDARNIAQVQAFPIDWSKSHAESGIVSSANLGFAYSSLGVGANSGKVGVWVTSQHNNVADTTCYDEVPYGGNGSPQADQICSWHNAKDGNDYLTAISPLNPTVTWRIDVTEVFNVGAINKNWNARAEMNQVSQLPPANGIGCNNFTNETLVKTIDGKINRYRTVGLNLGSKLWAQDLTDGTTGSTPRGLVQSFNGAWGAYARSDGSWAAFNANNGTIVATGTLPTGTLRGMVLSGNARDLFIGTTTQIQRFHLAEYTGGEGVPDNCLPDATSPCAVIFNSDTTSADPNPIDPAGVAVAEEDWCLGPTPVCNTVVLIFWLVVGGLGGWFLTGGRVKIRGGFQHHPGSPPITGAGCFIGLCISSYVGVIHWGWVVGVCLVSLAIIWFSRRGGT